MLPPNSNLRSGFHLLFVTVAILTMSVVTASPSVAQTPPQKLPSGCNEPTSMYSKYTESIPRSSLAKYRLAESLFMQHQYQASANAFRFALKADLAHNCSAMSVKSTPFMRRTVCRRPS